MDIDEFCYIVRNTATVSQLTPDTFRVMYGQKNFAILSVISVEGESELLFDPTPPAQAADQLGVIAPSVKMIDVGGEG